MGWKNGYYIKGSGSLHSVIPGLAKHYNVKCKAIGEDKSQIIKALKTGKTCGSTYGTRAFHR